MEAITKGLLGHIWILFYFQCNWFNLFEIAVECKVGLLVNYEINNLCPNVQNLKSKFADLWIDFLSTHWKLFFLLLYYVYIKF